jgi:hypothetical protein
MVRLHGEALLDAMDDDGTLAACNEILKCAILGDGIQANTAVSRRARLDEEDDEPEPEGQTDEDAELAAEMLAYGERAVAAMDPDANLETATWNLLDGISRGCALAEPVWKHVEDGPDAGHWHFESLRIKPKSSWKFVLDEKGKIAGFAIAGARQRSDRPARKYVPRSKGVLLVWNPKPSRPEGTPAYQAVYNSWNEKVLIRPERWKYTANFGSPFVWATAAENAQPTVNSQGQTISPVQAMLDTAVAMAKRKAGAGGYGSTMQILAPPGEGQAFSIMDSVLRSEMVERMLHMPRNAARMAAGPDDKDSPSDDMTYMIRVAKSKVERTLRDDFLMPLMIDRYGPTIGENRVRVLCPYFRLGRVDMFMFSRIANAMARMVQSGAIPPSCLPEMWDILGMMGFVTARDVKILVGEQSLRQESLRAQNEQLAAQTEAIRNPPAPPPGPAGPVR